MRKILIAIGMVLVFLLSINNQCFAQYDVIYACISKGKVRIVSDPSECRKNETAIYWNVVGEPGEPGDPGPPGEPGEDGLNCWDENEDGICDPGEDKNGDTLCDASDCQGPPGIGHFAVHDMNGLFLGYLLDYEAEWGTSPPGTGYGKLEIYNPDIPGYFIMSCASQSSSSPYIQGIASFGYFDFVSEDCSGAPPYINIGANPLGIFRDSYTDEFYVVDTTMPPISTDQLNSRLDFASGVCQTPYPGGYGGLAFPMKKISFPFAGALQQGNEVLQYPIRIGPVE